MLDIFQAIIIGIIEGFTEFLPISSTGHMIIASTILKIEQSNIFKAYLIIIQLSAILAVIILYRRKINIYNTILWQKILLASFPILIIGFMIKDYIKDIFLTNIVAIMFIVGGIIFIIIELFYKNISKENKIKNISDISFKKAVWIGFSQIFSLIPGTSRAGSTIMGGILTGLDRKTSTEFSFLLAIPLMLIISVYEISKYYNELIQINLFPAFIGFLVSFIVAFFTIKFFLIFLEKFTFIGFGIYRIIFGIILIYFAL